MRIEPITLQGRFVSLQPLTPDHVPALARVGLEPELWRWTSVSLASEADMRRYVEAALAAQRAGESLPFATIEAATATVVGSTRFGNIEPVDGRVEIGWTWVAPRWQRTAVNTEAKLLMLGHAFETWGCRRVELKTDALNARSRAAILRLGAKEEGTLRSHMVAWGGRVRDTVYFSILASEWPGVKLGLEGRLAR